MILPLLSILCGELCLLVSWCVGDRCDMAGSDEDHSGSRRPGLQVGLLVAGRSRGQVVMCMICTMHMDDEECVFLV
jgi:hypothetical protein